MIYFLFLTISLILIAFYEPHINSLEALGDIQIKRNKQKEISHKPFVSTVKADPWNDLQLLSTNSIRSNKSVLGVFAATKEYSKNKTKDDSSSFDSRIPIESKNTKDKEFKIPKKIKIVNAKEGDTSYLLKIENMRNDHTQLIQFNPKKLYISQNKHLLNLQTIDDNYILDKMSHKKMYYKSAQSKMVNPKSASYFNQRRHGSLDMPSDAPYSDYILPSRVDTKCSSIKNSQESEANESYQFS